MECIERYLKVLHGLIPSRSYGWPTRLVMTIKALGAAPWFRFWLCIEFLVKDLKQNNFCCTRGFGSFMTFFNQRIYTSCRLVTIFAYFKMTFKAYFFRSFVKPTNFSFYLKVLFFFVLVATFSVFTKRIGLLLRSFPLSCILFYAKADSFSCPILM